MIIYLLAGGIILLALEGVIPGFGFFGLAGLTALLAALFLALGADAAAGGIIAVILLGGIAIFYLLVRVFPDSRLGQALTLHLQSTADKGYTGVEVKKDLRGRKGIAKTVLRPAGIALIGDELVDVVTEGDFIEPGTPVTVVAVSGGRVIVRASADLEQSVH